MTPIPEVGLLGLVLCRRPISALLGFQLLQQIAGRSPQVAFASALLGCGGDVGGQGFRGGSDVAPRDILEPLRVSDTRVAQPCY